MSGRALTRRRRNDECSTSLSTSWMVAKMMTISRKLAVFVCTTALCTMTAAEAVAQSAPGAVTGSNISRKESGATGSVAPRHQRSSRAAFSAYARCAAELFPTLARRALAEPYGTEQQSKAVNSLTRLLPHQSERCFSAERIIVQGSSVSFAGAFAEHFVEHSFDTRDIEALAADATAEWELARPAPSNATERFGQCVIQTSAKRVRELIVTTPDSSAETAALATIVPALSPCIIDGQEVKFDRTSLRSILSTALYRELNNHRDFLKART